MGTLLPFIGPAFLVAVGFMDPGNWATVIEGGSRFGYELMWVVVLSNLVAILFQTLSARLGVTTEKHLAQVCREEYPWAVCALLWFFCEISIITLDLTMVLGTAIGLNVVLRMPILPSLFLMVVDSVVFLVILPLMEIKKAEVITIFVVGMVLLCFLLDSILTSPPPLAMVVGMWPKLRHDTLYTAISLLGANVMPHNFYLHSSLVQGQSKAGNQSVDMLCHYNLLDTLSAFSAVLVVNLTVLIVAVTTFHNAGLVVLTLEDAQALIEQILNNSISPAAFGLALLVAGQLSTLTGSTAGQLVSETFLQYKVHPWLHRLTIRAIAIFPAAICVWRYGHEGTYRMLVFSQVILALQLPFTVIPLIKITSCERIMGSHKNSLFSETLAWLSITLIGGINIWLIFDLVFGESEEGGAGFGALEYVPGFEWVLAIGGESVPSMVFATISLSLAVTLGFLIWLIFSPLKMDSHCAAGALWIEAYERREQEDYGHLDVATSSSFFDHSSVVESVFYSKDDQETVVVESSLVASTQYAESPDLTEGDQEASAEPSKNEEALKVYSVGSCGDLSLLDPLSSTSSSIIGSPCASSPQKSEANQLDIIKPVIVEEVRTAEDREAIALTEAEAEADSELLGKDDDEMDAWETLEQDDVIVDAVGPTVNSGSNIFQYEGPESGRSVRSDTSEGSGGGSGSGSLSRLSGLGRAARRQFASILEEFWGSLFDYYGKPIQYKSLGTSAPISHLDGAQQEKLGYQEGTEDRKPQIQPKWSWKTPNNLNDQSGCTDAYSRMWTHAAASTSSQMSQARMPEYGISGHEGERRYSSMRFPSHHEEYDYQPATIHGYRSPSFSGRAGFPGGTKARPLHLDMKIFGSESATGQGHLEVDSRSLRGERQNTYDTSAQPLLTSPWSSIKASARTSVDTEGSDRLLSQTEKHLGPSETSSYDSSQWDPLVYQTGRWNPLVYRATGELDMNPVGSTQGSNIRRTVSLGHSPIGRGGDKDRAPLVFDELSPSQSHKDGFSIQTSTPRPENHSLWSRQPFEQLFGSTDTIGVASPLPGRRSNTRPLPPPVSGSSLMKAVESEREILENFRTCLVKLLRLEGSDWLFRPDNGADEDLIAATAAMQRTTMEAEKYDVSRLYGSIEPSLWENHSRSQRSCNESLLSTAKVSNPTPHCGDNCVWDRSILISFGVWCIHRVLELSYMESRPELWGKYTYVLNRLQGVLEPAFSKPRTVPPLCRCINDPMLLDGIKRRSSLCRQGSLQGSLRDYSSGDLASSAIPSYQPSWPWGRSSSSTKGKGTSAAVFLERIKEVEGAVSSRKGRTGTAAGDIAFPKGKENLASALKRYKRKLMKPSGSSPSGGGSGGGGRRRGPSGFTPALFFAAPVCVSSVLLPSISS